jgi:hypothetical protein
MIKKHLFTLLALALTCLNLRPGKVYGQELSGYVYMVQGNQMPSPGRHQSTGRGVARAIFIYAPTTFGQATGTGPLFSAIKTTLVARTVSDSTGHYAIKLPTGKYSVFIAEGTGYFAGENDGDGVLNPVTITNEGLKKNFVVNIKSSY